MDPDPKPEVKPAYEQQGPNNQNTVSSSGWIKNNKLQFINIFFGFLFGLLSAGISFFFKKSVFVSFVFFSFSLALGGVWQKAVFFYLILFELLLIVFFSWLIYQGYFFLSFLVLPLFYFSFKFLRNVSKF